mgnify:CR=1 FL=1
MTVAYPLTITKTIKPFTYLRPSTVSEAVDLLAQHEGEARLLAGGTDLLVSMKRRAITPDYLVGLHGIADLQGIRGEEGILRIGALTTLSEIQESSVIRDNCYCLYEATLDFATPQVCNTATIGGNICRSSPSADTACPLLVMDASATVVGLDGSRTVRLSEFFTGPGTNVLENGILTEITVPIPQKPYGTAFAKMTRNSCDLAKANGAVRIGIQEERCTDVRIAVGAVAETPRRVPAAESVIEGLQVTQVTDAALEAAAERVADFIAPISDVRSSADYRLHVTRVLTKRLIVEALGRARLS